MDNQTLAALRLMAAEIMAHRLPDETIGRDGRPYLQRWWLVRNADATVANVYLHRFLRSDDEEPHDHPWPNRTVVLEGSYIERCFDVPDRPSEPHRVPGDIVTRAAGAVHAIACIRPGTVTLFTTGRKHREWGFHTAEGWVHWRDFDGWKAWRAAQATLTKAGARLGEGLTDAIQAAVRASGARL